MKKRRMIALILAAALAVLPLSGCREAIQLNDSLTIYASAQTIQYLTQVVSRYRKEYPGVPVELIDLSELSPREYTEQLAGELMSGKGPDLFIVEEEFMKQRDVYKLMGSGAFADVTEEIASHPELGGNGENGMSESYNQTVMEEGVWQGKRYLIPICYRMPILMTSAGIEEATGFDASKCGDFMSFIRESKPFVDAGEMDSQAPRLFGEGQAFSDYPLWMGSMFDYEHRSVTVDTPEFREAAEFYQSLYSQDVAAVDEPAYPGRGAMKRWAMKKNQGRILELDARHRKYFSLSVAYVENYDKPVVFPLRALDGTTRAAIVEAFAVNANSPNVKNACDFIYTALHWYQYVGMVPGIPVLNSYAADVLRSITSEQQVWGYEFYYEDEEGKEYALSGFEGDFSPLPEQFLEEFVSWTQELGSVDFCTPEYGKLQELMTPYYKGEATYEACVKKAQEQLTLYMTE